MGVRQDDRPQLPEERRHVRSGEGEEEGSREGAEGAAKPRESFEDKSHTKYPGQGTRAPNARRPYHPGAGSVTFA